MEAVIERSVSFSVNGRFLTQNVTGVQRYAREVVKAIDGLLREGRDANLRGSLITSENFDPCFSLSAMRTIRTKIASGIIWEQCVLPFYSTGALLNLCNQAPLGMENQIVCIHDVNTVLAPQSYGAPFRMFYGLTQPLLARRARKITTVSHFSARMLDQFGYCDEGKITVIPNGHEHVHQWNAGASQLPLKERQRPYIFVLGSQAKHKNIPLITSIAGELHNRGVDIIVAGGPAAIFADPGMAEVSSVTHLGFVSDDDLAALYQNALCLAFPSLTEGFGLPVLEAMALGCPVLASNIPPLREVAGNAALYADPTQPAAWIDQVEMLRLRSDIRLQLRDLGLVRATMFSWTTSAQRYLDLLRDLAAV